MTMAGNTFKVNTGRSSQQSLFVLLDEKLRISALFKEGLPVRYLPKAMFVVFICLLYIANNHWAERMVRKIDALQTEVEELRADYISLKSEYMFAGKQSEVAKRVKAMGLRESRTPPKQISVRKGEY